VCVYIYVYVCVYIYIYIYIYIYDDDTINRPVSQSKKAHKDNSAYGRLKALRKVGHFLIIYVTSHQYCSSKSERTEGGSHWVSDVHYSAVG